MARLFPFRGYRYDGRKIEQLSDVVSQPYDKISPEMLDGYLKRHPYNIARVIKNPNYSEAAGYLQRWIDEGVLRQDPSAAFYPYEQIFEFDGKNCSRLGFIALLALGEADVVVKGHERVLEEPLQDRLSLIRASESNQGLIFMLYPDASQQLEELLTEFKSRQEPVIEVVDEHRVTHRVWLLCDRQPQEFIVEALKNVSFYIADGHHRFQTSVDYYRECLGKGRKTAAVESFDKSMIALFNEESPGLRILPTHRGLRNLDEFYLSELLSNLEPFFEINKLDDVTKLAQSMQEPGCRMGLVVAQPFRIYVLRLRREAGDDPSFMRDVKGPARELDVNRLHEGILRPFLGIGPAEIASQKCVDYYRSRDELLDRLQSDQYQAAFFLNPTTLEQVRQISERGEKMPQKSTDFFPKLLTGLVSMKMQVDREKGA